MSETRPNPDDPREPLNDPKDPAMPGAPGEQASAQRGEEQTRPLKRPRRRRWPWVVLGVVLVLVALVVLAPTIAGTGPVRAFVVNRINDNLNGRVTIDDWSLGWFSGIRVSDLKVYDELNAEILHAPRIVTGLTLWEAITGNYALGNTQIDVANFVVRIDESGATNFEKLVKEDPSAGPAPDAGPTELPDVSGDITVNYRGTVEYRAADQTAGNQTVHVEPSTAVLRIPGINQPIANELALSYRVGHDPAVGTIKASGTVAVAQNNRLVLDQLAADENVSLSNVNLGALEPFLAPMLPGAQIAGVANGALDVQAKGLTGITAAGEIVVENPKFGGEVLQGDVVRTSRLTLPVRITRDVVDADTTIIRIEQLGVQTPEATITVAGEVPQQALSNIAAGQPPGQQGKLQLDINVQDMSAIANDLRNTLRLEKDVTITGGTLTSRATVNFEPQHIRTASTLDFAAQGNRGGQRVQIRPIHLESSAVVIPTDAAMPQMRDLKLVLTSEFAKITGGGESLAALAVDGSFDLDRLYGELAQFADLGDVQLAGNGAFAIKTSGDPTQPSQPIDAQANLNVQDLLVSGVTAQPIRQDRLAVNATGQVQRQDGEFTSVRGAQLTVTGGDPQSPLLDLQATADVNLTDATLPSFALSKLTVTDLPRAQQQYGAFVPALAEQQIQITNGQLYAQAAGAYTGDAVKFTKPLSVSLPNLTLTKAGRPVLTRETIRANVEGAIALPENGISGELANLSITSQSGLFNVTKSGEGPLVFRLEPDGTVAGSGTVTLAADAKRLIDVAQAFGAEVVVEGQPRVTSAQFNGTVALDSAAQRGTSINLTGELANLTVEAADKSTPVQNEKVSLQLKADAPQQVAIASPITAAARISSSFATAEMSEVRLVPQAGTWDMLQSAKVAANVPDLSKLYALITALTPPATPAQVSMIPQRHAGDARVMLASRQPDIGGQRISRPRPQAEPAPPAAEGPQAPLEVTRGGATLALDVSRDTQAKTTRINVTEARVTNLALRRGTRSYEFDQQQPIALALAAQINAADDPTAPDRSLAQQINSINITQLSGDLRVATLAMPKPITITNLGADTPSANGAVRVEGDLDRLTPLLSVLQGADPLPYRGAYVVTQNVATDGNQLTLEGEVAASKFQVLDGQDRGEVVFTEDKLTVRNAITANTRDKVAQIRALNVDMASSGALRLGVTGYVENWNAQLNGAPVLASARDVVADLNYDLEKLWPVIRPFVATPEDPMDEVAVVGQHQKKFTVNGPYYAGEFHEAIREIQVVGDLTIDKFVYPGIELWEVQLPVYLRKGVLQTVYAGRSAAERMPPPVAFNGGTMSLGGMSVDLTQPSPRLTIPDKYKLVSGASINPLLGDTLGKYVNPIFHDSKRAQGLLDVTITYCQNLALGEKLKSTESGRARIVFSLTDMDIANPTGSLLFGAIPGVSFGAEQADTFRGRIENAVVTIENGVVTEDITLLMVDPGKAADVIGAEQPVEPTLMPLRFQGNVNLSNLSQRINVSIPPALLGRFFRSDRDREIFTRIFPEGVPLTLIGTTVAPKVDPGNIAQRIVEGQIKGLVDPEKEGGGLGGLLEDALRRDRDKDREKQRQR